MRNIKIVGIAALAAVLLVGCANNPQGETSSSSVETSSSSAESSSSSSVESSVDMGDGSTDDIAVIVTDNQDIIKSSQSSQGDSSSNSDTSTDVSTSEPSTSEPTSQPTTSQPTSSSSNSGTTSSSKPTGETSKPTTSSSSSNSNTSKPTTSSSTQTGGNTSPYWNPDAPGNKPGPYKDSYYDASGNLHCKIASMPTDSYGYPVRSYYCEDGGYIMSKTESDKADEDARRILNGGDPTIPDMDWSQIPGWDW